MITAENTSMNKAHTNQPDDSRKFLGGNTSCLKLGQALQVNLVETSVKIGTSILDIDIGNFLALKVISTDRKGALLNNSAVFVTFLFNGIFYSFKSMLTGIVEKPIEFIIIDYPETIEEYTMRCHKRVECILPVKVIYDGSMLDGTIINISLGGCKLMVKERHSMDSGVEVCSNFHLGTVILIQISIYHTNEYLQVHGTIKNITQEKSDRYYGVQFIDLTDSIKQALSNYIHTIERIEQDHFFLYTLHSILQISMENIPFEEQLDRILSLILSLPGLSMQSIGSIFIFDETTGMLNMKVSRGISNEELLACASVQSGKCLCGIAIATGEVVFADTVDHRHTIRFSKMLPHGHYCVPIMLRRKPMGLINIVLREGHRRDKGAENYLCSVANALSGMIERNISQKRLEELINELQSANLNLKQSGEQLVQSEKMRSIGQLAAGIAHEINNPLGFVISNMNKLLEFVNSFVTIIETFKEFDVPETVRSDLDEIKKAYKYDYIKVRSANMIERSKVGLDRISKIVLDLKTYSKMDRAEILETDINESIAVTINLLTHEYRDRITIVTNYGTIPLIKCYSSQLNQVFMNILINACQAIGGEGEIKVKTSEENGHIMIEISDTGKGIPPEIHDRIFDPFFTTRPVGSGTGLGLSTSLGIVKKHNGNIFVKSAKGAGSTFQIKLPVNNDLD
ncbi:MAG: PilZ domain-containing protein [Nitrospirae bacterium]|nr:PilZ domain-containing protein [Nitrospirota bacterium]